LAVKEIIASKIIAKKVSKQKVAAFYLDKCAFQ
jgi:hypothetical protein